MNNANAKATPGIPSDTIRCPSCRGEIKLPVKRCPYCGRPMGRRGFFFYTFWAGLSLVVLALIAGIFYAGFQLVNRML
jgi:hypothetical protein